MKERIRAFTTEVLEDVQLAAVIAVGATAVGAFGIREWRAARAVETEALRAKEANDNAETDRAFKDAWIERMDRENELTPEEEDLIQPGE